MRFGSCQAVCYTFGMADEKRSSMTMVRTKPSLKALATQAAVEDGRTLSSLIEKLLTDHLRDKGYLPAAREETG